MGEATWRGDRFDDEPLSKFAHSVPQSDAAPEHDGHDHQMHKVDEINLKKLTHSRGPTAEADIAAFGRILGNPQNVVGRAADEVEACSVSERDRRSLVMGHHENRRSKRRLVSPPSLPSVVRPFTALRAELSPSHDLGADSLTPHTGQRAINGNRVLHLVDSMDDATVELIEKLLSATDRMVERSEEH